MEIVMLFMAGTVDCRIEALFPFPLFRSARVREEKDEQKRRKRAKRRIETGRIDRNRQISSLLWYDLISARRRPLKIIHRNPLFYRGPSVSAVLRFSPFLRAVLRAKPSVWKFASHRESLLRIVRTFKTNGRLVISRRGTKSLWQGKPRRATCTFASFLKSPRMIFSFVV